MFVHHFILFFSSFFCFSRVWSNADGSYCFEAASGAYTLSAAVSAQETSAGLTLSPAALLVTVTNAPLAGLDFASSRLTVRLWLVFLFFFFFFSLPYSSALLIINKEQVNV